MSQLGTTITVKKCRRDHLCFWCGEKIDKGTSYKKWTWEGGELMTIKTHPECLAAWNRASEQEGGPYETGPYEHKRGETYD